MGFWRLMDYCPELGVNLVRGWYEEQDDEVQAEFDLALSLFCANTDASDITALNGRYVGLYEICVDVFLPNDSERQFRAIGAWRRDSRDFVLFCVSEKSEGRYEPPLEIALTYKVAWEKNGRGKIYDHQFF
jgi:hypothetical protein